MQIQRLTPFWREESAAMYCKYWGTRLPDGSEFCPARGGKQSGEGLRQPGPLALTLVLFFSFALGVIAPPMAAGLAAGLLLVPAALKRSAF